MLRNWPFWMLAGAVLVLFFLPLGPFWFAWAFSTFIGAVLAMGRFGRFPPSLGLKCFSSVLDWSHIDQILSITACLVSSWLCLGQCLIIIIVHL